MKVLVGYASEHGSTREIAERIAARLREYGHEVDVQAMGGAGRPDEYAAIVLGSAIHDQRWLPAARDFVHGHAALLAVRPLWLFSVGLPGALRGPWRRLAMKEKPMVIAEFRETVWPREHRLFSGVIRPEHISARGRLQFRAMGCRYGDHRDWPAIDAWADDIAAELSEIRKRTAAAS